MVPAFFMRSVVHQQNLLFCAKLLEQVEYDTAKTLFENYCYRYQKHKPRSVNIWLREQVGYIRTHEQSFPVPLLSISTDVRQALVAKKWADQVISIVHLKTSGMTQSVNAQQLLSAAMAPALQWGFSPLLPNLTKEITDDHIKLAAAAVARMQDAQWWQRQIRKAYRRYKEHIAILVGKVRKGVSAYVSHLSLQDYRARKRASADWLKSMLAINPELGLEISLAEAVASSVSNPELRRIELMVRMRGFEDLAAEEGFVGEFYTWTAPSRFHACRTGRNGRAMDNPKYQGAMPRQTQEYITAQWAKARAKLARLGVKVFGFRVVEPHHDATPHWHMLLFVHPKQRFLLRWVLRYYACQHDKDELTKSYKPRFDYRAINPAKGSATGYIAKYIAKNIDGHKVGIDEETGTEASETVSSVAAWASYWAIRQFQQVGGPSVSVWRELRRLREATQNPVLEAARAAADQGKWAEFANAMGGIYMQRKDHSIQLSHLLEEDASQYGEDVKKLTGLCVAGSEFETRHLGWELSRAGLGSVLGERSEVQLGERSEQHFSGGSQRPWSSDNNCTQGSVLSEKDRIAREMAMLGLDSVDRQRLDAGATVTIDGLYVRIRNGQLITTTENPRFTNNGADDFGFEPQASKQQQWRRRILGELLSGAVPVSDFIDSVPDQELAMVIRDIDNALQQERIASPQAYKENPLLVMLQHFIEDTIEDHEFRSEYLD